MLSNSMAFVENFPLASLTPPLLPQLLTCFMHLHADKFLQKVYCSVGIAEYYNRFISNRSSPLYVPSYPRLTSNAGVNYSL